MKWIDITRELNSDAPCWSGDRKFELNTNDTRNIDGFITSDIAGSLHTGTHIDAPSHCLEGGNGVDQIPLEILIGPAEVFALTGSSNEINEAELEGISTKSTRVLLKNSFNRGLSPEAAEFLIQRKIQLIATESLSIATEKNELETHKLLLEENCAIIESIDLNGVEAGFYHLICLPIKVSNSDGAWVRALLSSAAFQS